MALTFNPGRATTRMQNIKVKGQLSKTRVETNGRMDTTDRITLTLPINAVGN